MKLNQISFALFCAISTSAFAQDVVIFGDSLSDVGQKDWNKKATYFKTDRTLNLLYGEHLANALGRHLKASSLGGTNYAYSGGVIVGSNNEKTTSQPNLELSKQVKDYLSANVKKDALHVMWAGGNDLATVLAVAMGKPEAERQTYVMQSIQQMAQTMAQQWAMLQQAGVDTVIAPTIPNVTYTPEFFDKLGETAGKQINVMSKNVLDASYFTNAFKKAVQTILEQPSHNATDFNELRLNTLSESTKGFYDALGWWKYPLIIAGYNEEFMLKTLTEQYQNVLQQAALATTLLNASITRALNQAGGSVVRIDTDAFLKDMIERPAEYGLTNTTGVACKASIPTTKDSNCAPADQNAADEKLFADSFHPGPVAHKAMSDYILNVLNAPKEMGTLTTMAQYQSDVALDFARTESNRNRLSKQTEQTVDAIVSYQKVRGGDNLHVGVKVQFNPQWQLSALVSHQDQKVQEGQTNIRAKSRALSTSLRYDVEQWWLGGSLQANNSRFKTHRTNFIGRSTHLQTAEPTSQSLSMALFGGYELKWDKYSLALIGDINKTKTALDAFGTNETGLMKMQFAERRVHSLKTGTGVSFSYQGESFQPYLTTRFVKEWNKDLASVQTGFNGSQFITKLTPEDKSWVNVQAGLQWKPLNTGFYTNIGLSKDLGRKHNFSNTHFQAGVGVEF
ncbi:TPA: autotransporter domain-containing protein [Pasteurella multocida]|nr:autotransporter domain-containing protein [Pasteurella multocida]